MQGGRLLFVATQELSAPCTLVLESDEPENCASAEKIEVCPTSMEFTW